MDIPCRRLDSATCLDNVTSRIYRQRHRNRASPCRRQALTWCILLPVKHCSTCGHLGCHQAKKNRRAPAAGSVGLLRATPHLAHDAVGKPPYSRRHHYLPDMSIHPLLPGFARTGRTNSHRACCPSAFRHVRAYTPYRLDACFTAHACTAPALQLNT